MSVLSIQFKVGVPRTEALVRLHDTISANRGLAAQGAGRYGAYHQAQGIDDVPIVTLTLHDKGHKMTSLSLEKLANQIETDLKRVKERAKFKTVGGPSIARSAWRIDPARLAATGFTIQELRIALQSANLGLPVGNLLHGDNAIQVESARSSILLKM